MWTIRLVLALRCFVDTPRFNCQDCLTVLVIDMHVGFGEHPDRRCLSEICPNAYDDSAVDQIGMALASAVLTLVIEKVSNLFLNRLDHDAPIIDRPSPCEFLGN